MQPSLPDQFNSIPFNCYPCFISYSMSLCSLLCQINSIQFHLTAIPASSHTDVFMQPSLPDQNSIPFNCCFISDVFMQPSLPDQQFKFNCYPCFISYSMSLCSLLWQNSRLHKDIDEAGIAVKWN